MAGRRRAAAFTSARCSNSGTEGANDVAISNATLDGNIVTGGTGGAGGRGVTAAGGNAGIKDTVTGLFVSAAGGGLYDNSANSNTAGKLALLDDTLAANSVAGGTGWRRRQRHPIQRRQRRQRRRWRRRPGKSGGAYLGDYIGSISTAPVTVYNSTFGGLTGSNPQNNPLLAITNANVLVAGSTAATAATAGLADGNVPNYFGGSGGVGGSVEGGGVYLHTNSGPSTFINDTLVGNVAALLLNGTTSVTGGLGGAAGSGSSIPNNGTVGANGTAGGGGIFNQSTTKPSVGNTIIDLNDAGSNDSSGTQGSYVSNPTPDVAVGSGGAMFADQGNNILGAITSGAATTLGFTGANDQTNISASSLNIGPLLPTNGASTPTNGGPTPTDGLIATEVIASVTVPASVAIDAGNNALIPAGIATDERATLRASSTAPWTSAPSSTWPRRSPASAPPRSPRIRRRSRSPSTAAASSRATPP